MSLGNHDGGASAYSGGGGGTEYRDVSSVGGSASSFTHYLSQVTSPLGETTEFVRGANGRINRIEYPDGGEKLISYGSNGLPSSVTLPQGTTLTFAHDSALREVSRTSSLGESRAFTYGIGDRIETMTDGTGTTTYHYDDASRFTGITYPHGGSVRYTRDKLGRTTHVRVKAMSSATESVTQYAYDENGNLHSVTDPLNGVTTYVYDQVDRLTSRTLPNGVVTTYGYDSRDRVLSVVHRNSSNTVLASSTYVRSASGEPTKITREDGSYVDLTYDDALRVETETYRNASNTVLDAIEYEYDADGNRTSKTSLAGGYESYAYQPGFKLTGITTTAETESYGYDGGGRLTSFSRGGHADALEYNSDDKLTRVVKDSAELVRYTYDGAGRRVGKIESGATTRYLVAPNVGDGFETAQAATDASGNVLARYVFAGEHPIARINASGVAEYYLQDAMGSVIGMSSAAGSSTATIKYDSFGNVTSATGAGAAISSSLGSEPRYHGMQLDAASGLYHVRARTYDARAGRFTSRDPVDGIVGTPEANHPYAFAYNNPIVFRDPSGEFSLGEMSVTMSIIGITASLAIPSYTSYIKRTQGYKQGWNGAIAGMLDSSGADDFAAGVGDAMFFGMPCLARAMWGGNAAVDSNSTAHTAGAYTGMAMGFLEGAGYAAMALNRSAGVRRMMGVQDESMALFNNLQGLDHVYAMIGKLSFNDDLYRSISHLGPVEAGRHLMKSLGISGIAKNLSYTRGRGLTGAAEVMGTGLTPGGAMVLPAGIITGLRACWAAFETSECGE